MLFSKIVAITCLHLIEAVHSFRRFSHRLPLSSLVERRPIHPNDVEIPLDKISFSFSRSSGPGGQNVNKVNSKAELRWRIDTSDWLARDIRQRISVEHRSKINKEGELVITSQEHRYRTYGVAYFP
jgi:protein subunit release factor B